MIRPTANFYPLVPVRDILPHSPGAWNAFQRSEELSADGPEAQALMTDVNGTRRNDQNELWSYGAEAQRILTDFDRLRYRLMPYIYSIAGRRRAKAILRCVRLPWISARTAGC